MNADASVFGRQIPVDASAWCRRPTSPSRAVAFALPLLLGWSIEVATAQPALVRRVRAAAVEAAPMRGELMARVDEIDRSGSGIFNEDVTPIVAPHFASGASLKDVAATVRAEGLGDLEAFKGKTRPPDGTMFVSRGDLSKYVAHVFVVTQFSFRTTADGALALDHVRAFLRSRSM